MISRKTTARSRLARRKKGFTLTEIAIVLGIIGLILGAIWVAAASVYNAQRLNTATTATLQIAQGIRALYATSSTTGYTAVTDITQAMYKANVIPNNLIDTTMTDDTRGPFPGGATFVLSTNDQAGFFIQMSGLTQAACINMLVGIGGTSRDPGLFAAFANANSGTTASTTNIGASTTGLTTAVTPGNAILAAQGTAPGYYGGCNLATGALYDVNFGFTLK